jgi:branched-chain amino acid transport system substrate-binding protein
LTASRKLAAWIAAFTASALPLASLAGPNSVKIGVLTDFSGPLAAYYGPEALDAVKMAVQDFGGKVNGLPIEVVSADHLNKADVGASIASKWYDEDGVDAIIDVGNSAVALAVQNLSRTRKKAVLFSGPSVTDLYGKACSAYSVKWGHDVYMFSHAVAEGLLKQGADTWFLLVTDYAFGQAMQAEVTKVISGNGGKVVGVIRHPLNNPDFASFVLQAQSSKAKVIGLLNSVQDLSNSIKQAREFGVTEGGQKLAALAFTIADAKSLGPTAAQGIVVATNWYWNTDADTKAWSDKFYARNKRMPSEGHAANYSLTLHYLRALQEAKTLEASAVVKKMKELPVNDFYAKGAKVRADGRLMQPTYIAQVKSPAESKSEWDLYKIIGSVPPEKAFMPMSEGNCPLVK